MQKAARLEARLEARAGDLALEEQRMLELEVEREGLLREAACLVAEKGEMEARLAQLGHEAEALAAEALMRDAREAEGSREEDELLRRLAVLEAREAEVLSVAAAEAGLLRSFRARLEAAGAQAALELEEQSNEARTLEIEAERLRRGVRETLCAQDGLRKRLAERRREAALGKAAEAEARREAAETERTLEAELRESGPRLAQLAQQAEFFRGELALLGEEEAQTESK